MAAITLREYVREIEKQVDGGRNEEAIAHSRHVLESFPRYVDIYRLLGKAYLESQRYGDAGDIFQRVLSAAPEDFVSHVGMSIIREDEGNLDEAIWHMERAFDVQPSNSAIQEELRRLYGRRDNIEPPKIRLTRGALARMYYKGELYLQAIAEVRAALNEAPDRLDLQALLAEIYAKAGQRAEAVEMAGQVLHKLPFCLAANQIMVELLIGTEKESKIETFFQRLSQLDPYAAQVTAAAPRAENVPDQAIRLNKLDYKARDTVEGGPSQPLWAATLGIEVAEMATGREESLPEWLAAGPSTGAGESELVGGAAVPAFASDEAQAPAEGLVEPAGEEEQIPDWMKDLEWGPASEESLQTEAALQFEEEGPEAPAVEGELAKAEIPDWLQALAPAEVLAGAKAEDEDLSPWLDQLFSAEPEAGEAEARAGLPIMEGEAQGADWLAAGLALGAAAAGEAALGQEEETAEEAEMLGSEAVSEAAGEAAEEALPDWLAEISPEGEMAEVLPSWLFESEAAPGAEATVEAAAEEEAELPEWLFESEAAPGAEVMTEEETAEEAVELPEWLLEAAAVEQVETDEEGVEERAEEAEGIPDWLEAAGAVTGAAAGFKASDWLSEEEAPEEEAVLAAADLETEMEPAAEEWQAEAETVVVEDTLPSPAEIEAEAPAESAELEEAFAWLDSLLVPVKETVAAIEEPAPVKVVEEPMPGEAEAATPPQTPAAEIPMDEDAAFAWLESLAVRQGAQEALLLKPEERSETPPEWLKAAAATAAAGAVLDKIGEEEGGPKEAVEEPVEPALPEAMEEPAFAESAEEAVEAAAPAPPAASAEEPPELPDWLAAPSEETREETLEWTPPPLSRRKYDLNKITLVEMEQLPGIGFIMAQKVIDYRNAHGSFMQIDDLLNVPDFNVATLEGVRDNLYLESAVEPVPAAARIPTQLRPGTGPLALATGAGLPNEVVKARGHLSEGYLEEALGIYDELIRSKKHLTWVIEDLTEASNRYPNELYIWQSLGDAYIRTDQAGQALQSYIRAEKLLLA